MPDCAQQAVAVRRLKIPIIMTALPIFLIISILLLKDAGS
jgi:hypothetical protein